VGVEGFDATKRFDHRCRLFEVALLEMNQADAAAEVFHRQAGEKRGRSTGRQNVARAGGKIADGFGRPRADENRASCRDLFGNSLCALGDHFHVLGSKAVAKLYALLNVGHHGKDTSAGHHFGDRFFASQCLGLLIEFSPNGFRQLFRGGHEECFFGTGSVLGLRKQVGGNVGRIGGVIGQHGDFARASDHCFVP